MRPFKFAVLGDAKDAEFLRAMVRKTEDLGFSTLFFADHVDLTVGDTGYPPQHGAVIPALTAAAAWSRELEIGSRVICTDYHVPATLAKEAATIDALSEGRLLLGLGAGWHGPEYTAMGLDFAPARERVQKLEEMVALVKAYATGEPVDVDGAYVSVHGSPGLPASPTGRPPRLLIGGAKPRVLTLAAREADVVSYSGVIVDPALDVHATLQERLALVREAAGDRFVGLDIELMAMYVEVTDDIDGALARAAGAFGVDAAFLRDHPLILVGPVGRIADQLERQRERYGINYVTTMYQHFEALAPVVARLAGT
jgi:probable F420-dependent oxidoreductase